MTNPDSDSFSGAIFVTLMTKSMNVGSQIYEEQGGGCERGGGFMFVIGRPASHTQRGVHPPGHRPLLGQCQTPVKRERNILVSQSVQHCITFGVSFQGF